MSDPNSYGLADVVVGLCAREPRQSYVVSTAQTLRLAICLLQLGVWG